MAHLEDAGRRSAERAEHPGVKLGDLRGRSRFEQWLPVIVIGVFLILWEWLARMRLISPLFFPPPTAILQTLWQMMVKGTIFVQLKATLNRLLIGFAAGGMAGLLVGLGMGWSPRLRTILDPLVAITHPIPKIAIFPLIMIIFGIGEASKVVAIAIAAFFPMLINAMLGVRQLNPVYFEVTNNYGANAWKTFSRVVVPGSLPAVLTGSRLAINMAMVISISVELLSAKEGLGVIIWYSWQTLRIEDLYASLVVISLLGFGINVFLQFLSRTLTPWAADEAEQNY